MIATNSRYVNAQLVTQQFNGKDIQYITPSEPQAYTFQYSYYVTDGSDRIDTIAAAFLSDPTQWFLIGNANPQVMNWLDIPPGTIIRIPTIPVIIQ